MVVGRTRSLGERSSSADPPANALHRQDNELEHASEHELEQAWVICLLHGWAIEHAMCQQPRCDRDAITR